MKDLIFIDIVVEHMQKMHKQITCESKEIDIMSKIGNQFVLKAKTVNEIMVLSDMLKLLTGMTRAELTKEIRMREIQTIKEIDEYVKIKKDLLEQNKNQFAITGEQDVVSTLKEFFKDQPNVLVVDVSKKPIIFGTAGHIDSGKEMDLDELPESENGKKLVRFKEWVCELQFGKYHGNHRTAIELVCHKTGEPIATATVNVPNISLKENEVIIKDYSENQGMFQALFNAGVVKLNRIDTQSEWVDFHICELLIEPKFD